MTAAHSAALAFAEARAPRYTSYPTAVQFSAEVDEATHREWLGGLAPDQAVSLYVHVPFCRRLCWYCGCNTRVVNGTAPVADYVRRLGREAALAAAAVGGPLAVSTLHLGGGSPDSLSPQDVDALFDGLNGRFELQTGAEIAAEVDPTYVTQAWIAAAARHGLSRASLGVQDFSSRVQAAINRPQSVEVVAEATRTLRAHGVGSINFDLMYGLPHQNLADVRATVEQCLRLNPERLAVFGYAHVPWRKSHQRLIDAAALPGAAERLEQSEIAAEALVSAGYVRIGLDHFARPDDAMARSHAQGRLRRNFQGYTTDTADTMIGLGASSISRLPQGFVQNTADLGGWSAAVSAGRLPTARGVEFIGDDRLRAEAIERLMCDGELDTVALCQKHDLPLDVLDTAWGPLETLELQGFVALDGPRVTITPPGRAVVRTVCTAFDRYFAPAAGRHAQAV